jgi:1,4-alpha-glucan branching enzyme
MEFAPISQEFYTGCCFDAYRFFGAHPAEGGKGWVFRVWAPGALEVQLSGDFNAWKGQPMDFAPGGVWSLCVPEAKAGQFYKFNIHGRDGRWVMHCDPYAFASEVRPDNAGILTRIDFAFDDAAWMASRGKCFDRPLNIYELHAGSWKHRSGEAKGGPGAWLRYDELAEALIPWLLEHHYTHVELLPLSEHPFDGSWGYQTTGYFSVTSRYGTPAQFAAFVSACHKAGIGVLMDAVPVHFAANEDALARFDGTCLYEYDSDVGQSEWGTYNFNFYRGEVRSFLCSAFAFWMDIYHCDGIRVDAVSRAIYWLGDPARGVNEGAVRFIQCANHGLNERWPTGIYVAEDSTNYLKVTAPTRYGGLGFDYKWDLGWMHDTLDYFATPFGERRAHYGALTFSMQYFYNELYLLSLSHDEVVHGKKTIIDKLWGTYREKCSQARALYFYMYLHPGKKLNFMGNELAHFREWDESRELDWPLLKYPFHNAFQRYMARLGALYESEPALHDGEYDRRCFSWVACESANEGLYAWLRQSRGETLLCILNTSDKALTRFPLYLTFPCGASLLLNTEAKEWGGASTLRAPLHTTNGGVYGRDYTLRVNIPAMAGLLYRLDRRYNLPKE